MERNAGSGWRRLSVFAEAEGTAVIAPSVAAGGFASVDVVFPTGAGFTVPPRILLTPSNGRLTCSRTNGTTAGFTLGVSNWSPGSAPANSVVDWIARQATAAG